MLRKLSRVLALFSPQQTELAAVEIARQLQWPKSTAYRIVGALQDQGFLDYDETTARYRLGIRLAELGELAQRSRSVQRLALPALRRLSATTGETATLMVLVGTEAVTIDVVESSHPLVQPGHLGGKMPLHASAGGKAFLAWALSRETLDQLLRGPLKRYTPTTLTSGDALYKDLALARKRGYTAANGEFIDEIVCVAAPVRDFKHAVVAAVTVGGARWRASASLDVLGRTVVSAAHDVSHALGYRPR